MSRFFSSKYKHLSEYVPGEQPKDKKYIKLNTNESPFPPSEKVINAVLEAARGLNLYCDPECSALTESVAEYYGVNSENVLMTNGSDEILNFAFSAFGDIEHPFVFPDITYGFYPVFARMNGVPFETIALNDDFNVDPDNYCGINKNVVIANPNAPTGLVLSLKEIEKIIASNKNNVIIIDEAYIDFGGESSISLIKKYDNLLVSRTFSKSFSLAGGRLGFGVGSAEIIKDLKKIKYSTNPYNVNSMTQSAGIAAMKDVKYYLDNCKEIIRVREKYKKELSARNFFVTDSNANFIFAKHDKIPGALLYSELKKRGVLVRHFSTEKISDFIRITVGTDEQMQALLKNTDIIIGENR